MLWEWIILFTLIYMRLVLHLVYYNRDIKN
jgi:hypothetical protein